MAESGDFDRAGAANGLREAVAFYARKSAVLGKERERVAEDLGRLDAEPATGHARRESLAETLGEIAAAAGDMGAAPDAGQTAEQSGGALDEGPSTAGDQGEGPGQAVPEGEL
jgi:hypothetical protein